MRRSLEPTARRAGVGSLEWMDQTAGLLSRGERRALRGDLARSQVAFMANWLRLLSLRRPALPSPDDLGALSAPASRAALDAEQWCREMLSPALAAHSHRTFLWADALARRDGIAHDAELLYLASLYHDGGLDPLSRGPGAERACFTAVSADVADHRAGRSGWGDERRARLCEAITLHLNPVVGLDHGPEAHLLHAGASLDTTGIRLWQLERATVGRVLREQPRTGFKREFVPLWRSHARAVPLSRASYLRRYGAFGVAVRLAPFRT